MFSTRSVDLLYPKRASNGFLDFSKLIASAKSVGETAPNRVFETIYREFLLRLPASTPCSFSVTAPGVLEITSPNYKKGQKSVAILGLIHGNEPCGLHAILNLAWKIGCGELVLNQGKVKLCLANELAFAENQRFKNHNLNRCVVNPGATFDSSSYEHQRARIVRKVIRESDAILDLHSVTADHDPFLVCPRNPNYAQAMRAARVLGLGKVLDLGMNPSSITGTTIDYAASKGKALFGVECGRHDDQKTFIKASEIAQRFLGINGLVGCQEVGSDQIPEVYVLCKTIDREKGSFFYYESLGWLNAPSGFQIMKPKEAIGCYEASVVDRDPQVRSPDEKDLFLIFPGPEGCEEGDDLVSFARRQKTHYLIY